MLAHFKKVLRKDDLSKESVNNGKNWHVFHIASFWLGGSFSRRGAQLSNLNNKGY